MSDTPTAAPKNSRSLPVTLPDTSLAIPRGADRPDLFPIRQPEPQRPIGHRPSLAARRRRRFVNT
jgi:hypothetical protein